MKPWAWVVLAALSMGPISTGAGSPEFHLMFKPVRSVRIDTLVQIELDLTVTNLMPGPVTVNVNFLGTPGMDGRYVQPFGMRDLNVGSSVTLRQLITIPVSEAGRWEHDAVMPRFRVEYAGPTGRGVAVLDAVPAGPPDNVGRNPVRR